MAKRDISPMSLSFLDVMCCGFGAIILLVMIMNGDVLKKREHRYEDLRAEFKRVTELENLARANLEKLQSDVQAAELREADLEVQATGLARKIDETKRRSDQAAAKAAAAQDSIRSLAQQSAAIQSAVTALREKNAEKWRGGRSPVGFSGDGERQYLTGLKLGAERTLILVDSSASMLDETVVNVVRRKLMSAPSRQTAPKWQRALRTTHWLLSNLRPGKKFQIYDFSTDARPLVAGSDGTWLSTDDTGKLTAAIAASRRIVPDGGTSLHQAFDVIRRMSPRPDSVILLTDGLATQGKSLSPRGVATVKDRERFTSEAIRDALPPSVPVNTLLFPMEGDPTAAGAFWLLAIKTRGSFLTPARDWP
jgi:hypothetical protein